MTRLLSLILRRQDGIALPMVIGTLSLVTALAVSTYTVAVEGSHLSQRDRDSKRALAAAEAGLQMAMLKITEIKPDSGECVTSAAVPLPETGECPAYETELGNGATYSYVVATPTSGDCPTVPGFTATPGMDRCITSTGEVNGVKRRLQLRFYFNPPFLPWGNAGLVGKNKVEIDNNKTINSPVGTNGQVSLGNNSTIVGNILIPDSAPDPEFKNGASSTLGVKENPRVARWSFPVVDWDTPRDASGNDNSKLAGISGWNATTKILTLSNQQAITLQAGTYHLCGLYAPNGNQINIPDGAFVRLFIDSSRSADSGCDASQEYDGRFVVKNQGRINGSSTDPKAEQLAVFVYGTTESNDSQAFDNPADVDMNNGVSFWGTIWAPDSTIEIWNNQTIAGGFTAAEIELKNNGGFSYDADIANQALPGTASAENLSWFECKREPTDPDDPESGCS